YAQTAKKYGCNQSTLLRWHCGVYALRARGYAEQQHLNTTQENKLMKYIDVPCKRGLLSTREMIRNFVVEILNSMLESPNVPHGRKN
ncbi:uncharacterized protein M421DRAFT_58297, partial [Didymella exigua CBS 183.55]